MKLKLQIGDEIKKREGVGEDFGYLFLSSPSSRDLQEDIDFFFNNFKIEMS